MRKWHETTIIPEENTFSDDLSNQKSINTVNSELDPDTNYQKLKRDLTWKTVQENNIETSRVRVFDVAAYILEKIGVG